MDTLKYSRQRESIKEFLMTRKDHPTADVVYENVRKIYPNISLGTVYRNLSLLSELGEIQKLSNFGGADHFDGCVTPHCHFMCKKCGAVLDLETENLNDLSGKAVKNFSGEITECDIRFFGTCPKCMNN